MMPSVPQIILLLVIIVAVVVPPVLVIRSPRVSGGTKFAWIVATLIFSWLAYAAFLVFTKRQQDALLKQH